MTDKTSDLEVRLLDAAVDLMGRAGRGGRVQVVGESMRPTLAPGDVLAVDFSPGPPSRGDLLLFRQAGYLVVHRLLGPARFPDGRPSHRTRGDGVIALDPHVDPADVVGRVIAFRGPDGWRDLRGVGGRVYAWMIAWHDFTWAAAGVLARRLIRRSGDRASWFRPVAWAQKADRLFLTLAHRVFFRLLHRRVAEPVVGESRGEGRDRQD
jgi:hypothetical protein